MSADNKDKHFQNLEAYKEWGGLCGLESGSENVAYVQILLMLKDASRSYV